MKPIEKTTIDALRVLPVECVQSANSGHPGMPMGTAPIAYTLWANYMKHNPKNPKWDNRDRFVLSAGHGSALLYSLLHLFGYGLTIEDLKQFRQIGSKTPGHPEYGHTVGVETTTGPLGQGFATAAGMALAESHLAAKFNKDNYNVVDHYTYVISGDGCMMEGITSEAASLAGTMKLGKLIVFYDDNSITIEGNTDIAFQEDVAKRYQAYNWQVIEVADANDIDALAKAIEEAKADTTRPTLIKVTSVIGYGSPELAGTHGVHGAPLGDEKIASMKKFLCYDNDTFCVPQEVYDHINEKVASGEKANSDWDNMMAEYAKAYPELNNEYKLYMSGELSEDLLENKSFFEFEKGDAGRSASSTALNRLAEIVPNIIGGSADLGPSNKSVMSSREYYSPENKTGSNIHFGVREHAMGAMVNGIALHGGLKAYCATFFVFSDYMKHSMRLSALMGLPVTYILTHDSIGVGEDGPTHQPIEQLAAMRSIPNFIDWRPADPKEAAVGWYLAANSKDKPYGMALSRQNLPLYDNSGIEAKNGAYILKDSKKATPDMLLMASGSEVELIMTASEELEKQGVDARVISMPSMNIYKAQCDNYKQAVMPKECRKRLAVEAGSTMPWYEFVGLDGAVMGIDSFGICGNAKKVYAELGLTVEKVVEKALELLK